MKIARVLFSSSLRRRCARSTFQALRLASLFNLIFFIVITVFNSTAKPSDYLIDVWTGDNGLPDSSVTSIAQTPDGYLWIGTYNGLVRFDGVRFVTFDPINTPALKNARITGLFVDAWGTLWINTFDGSMASLRNGIFTHEWQGGNVYSVFSKSNQVFFALAEHNTKMVFRTETNTQHGDWKELPLVGQTTGYGFKQDGSGTIWYLHDGIPYRIVGTNSEAFPPSSGWPGKRVYCLATGSDGHIWVGSDKGIARWNDGRFENQTPAGDQSAVNVLGLYCTRNGCWVFGDGKVRKCVDRHWVEELNAKAWRELVGANPLDLNGYQDRDGGIWFTHLGTGLFHITADGKTEHFTTENGLPSNLARCWFQDYEGNIWAGLIHGGLVCLHKKLFQVIGKAQGLGSPAISSVCEDSHSNVWIGTFSGGLYRWRDGQLERFNLPAGAYTECFYSIYPEPQNRLWLSAGREDLYTLFDGQIHPFGTIVHGIKTVFVDKQSRVWLGKLDGLACVTDGILQDFPATNGLNNIRALAEDRSGGIWIGTGDGILFHYGNGGFTRYQAYDDKADRAIWSLLPEDDGTLWVGTSGGGLLRFNDGKFTRYTTQDGLPNDIICQILDDGFGNLWIGSHKGIFRVQKKSFQDFDRGKIQSLPCVSYGLPDGLPTLECSGGYQPACWRSHDGRLWFATLKGLVSVIPNNLPHNDLPPPVVIEEVLLDGKMHTISSASQPFLIPPGKHQLDFRYTALSFMAPDKVAFRYKLQGLDEDWVDGGTKRSAHYGPLRPGKYRFRVIACNNDGVWNETGASMNLVMQPYLWQTLWFQFLTTALAIIALILTVHYMVKARMRKKLDHLQQQQAVLNERLRIARDLHDDLGASVAQVGLMAEGLAKTSSDKELREGVTAISSRVRGLARDLDAVVWSVNPREDSLEGLGSYIVTYFLETLRQSKIRPRLQVEEDIPPIPLKPEIRHQLFLVVKEAINNVIKHSQATEATLEVGVVDGWFNIRIQDNGCGFDLKATEQSRRNGLRNMRARAQEMGCAFKVAAEPSVGTTICLRFPLPPKSSRRN